MNIGIRKSIIWILTPAPSGYFRSESGASRVTVLEEGIATMAFVRGTPGDDNLAGTKQADVIFGLGGDDVVIGNGGNDWVKTDDGADNIATAAGRDLIFSGGGDDLVEALEGNDFIDAGGGNDEAGGGAGADMVFGGHGDDELNAGEGNDYVDGGAGADELSGGSDNDIIYDGSGSDRIEGRRGNDKIFLSADSDADIIGFRPGEAGVDTIFGFDIPPEKEADQSGGDRIDLQRFKLDEDQIPDQDQVLREGTRFGTQISVDPTGGDDADAVKLAVLVGIRPEDLGGGSIDPDIFLL